MYRPNKEYNEEDDKLHLNKVRFLIKFLVGQTTHTWCRFKALPAEMFPFFTEKYARDWKLLQQTDIIHKVFLCLRDCPRWFVVFFCFVILSFSLNSL